MLGLNMWRTISNHSAPYPWALQAGLYNLYIYTDIIQYQMVGDNYSTVRVTGDYGDMASIRYNTIHYLLLSKNHIKSIRIEIKMDLNRCVDFVFGKTIVKLHFKPSIS